MEVFTGSKLGRYMIIGLKKDDLILESIREAIQAHGIRNAIVTSGIAATHHMRWHHIENTEDYPTDTILETDGPIEVGGIGGLILNGVPHLHCSFADHHRTWSGHLEEGCRIQYVGEITLIELLDVELDRVADQFGVRTIHSRKE